MELPNAPQSLFRSHPRQSDAPTNGKSAPGVSKASILPILLPPATLRPIAFRTLTKKHNLTFTSTTLQLLATFIGKHCGSGWREEGLAEVMLDDFAKTWKKSNGGVIIEEGQHGNIKSILQNLEDSMVGGRVLRGQGVSGDRNGQRLSRQTSADIRPAATGREDSQTSLGISALEVSVDEEERDHSRDLRSWLRVVDAHNQPRMEYNTFKKFFEPIVQAPSMFPSAHHKTKLFRARYNLVHQRLLRNESFQTPSIATSRSANLRRVGADLSAAQTAYKITQIANLLGRMGSSHLLLGLLAVAPTGELSLTDLTASVTLDLSHARPVPENGAWFCPGMMVLIDGIYEEESEVGTASGNSGGVGGTIPGRFVGISVGGPPCERREVSLGIGHEKGKGDLVTAGGGFGWIDFLGVGSERAQGARMRRIEQGLLEGRERTFESRSKVVIMGELHLDNPKVLEGIRRILGTYAAQAEENMPTTFVMMGNFIQRAAMSGGTSGSIQYKESFDGLAAILSDFPSILQASTFVFVPGDNDPWSSAFSAGSATVIPREGVPELFTSRIRRAFLSANADAEHGTGTKPDGEAIWTSNPSRMSLFGPVHEIVLFRDDISGRLRRTAVIFKPEDKEDTDVGDCATEMEMEMGMGMTNSRTYTSGDGMHEGDSIERMNKDEAVEAAESHVPKIRGKVADKTASAEEIVVARKLVKTILDQGYLSPFPHSIRPTLWDYASALQLYPLPTALVLADAEASPFTVTYEGCHVMNPGRLVAEDRRGIAKWIEYDARTRKGRVLEARF